MRAFLIAVLTLLWLILGWLFYKDHNTCCPDKSLLSTSPAIEKSGPILFNWGNSAPILGDGWSKMKDSLATFANGDSKLEITGQYCKDAVPAETDSLGYQRANETRKLFPEIGDDKIVLLSKEIICDSTSKVQKFEAVSFASRIHTENIKETEDATLIYFPSNSTLKLNSTEVENYLNDVAERVIKSGESISLTGNTDDVWSDDFNLRLGQKRADIIKNYLITKGVDASKIVATSKGESNPIADNNTEEGKSKNRRTELQIIK